MKTCQGTGSFQRVQLRLLLCFISSVVFASSAFALSGNNINSCHDCHGSPIASASGGLRPVDGAWRNITTGSVIGNHQTHVVNSLSSSPIACTPCHGPAPVSVDHRDGKINMRMHINSSNVTTRGFYDKPVGSPAPFFNQTSVPQLSTCNSVNCHFRTTTGLWGSSLAPGQSEASCAYCHNSSGATPMTTGNHTRHITKFGSTITTCANCHTNQTTFDHATSASHSTIRVSMAGAPSLSTGGTYAAGTHATYPNYYTTTGYGTCNTVYCHSSAQGLTGGAPTYKAQTWGVSLTCSGCHGDSTTTLLSGSHSKHLIGAYTSTSLITCGSCHGAGYTFTAVNDPTHVDQTINISLTTQSPLGTYSGDGTPQNSNFGACSTTICHGKNSATWGSSVSNQLCTECHGQGNVAYASFSSAIIAPGGAGVDTGGNTAANSPRVGAHQTHLLGQSNISGTMKCGECHFTHTTIQDATHLNFTTATVTYQNAVLAKKASHTPAATRATGLYNCSNVYCHQGARVEGTAVGQSGFTTRTNPVWNDTALIGGTTLADSCTNKCHGMPPNASTNGDTHYLRVATTFSELATNCAGCHSETLNNPIGSFAAIFKDKTKHIDGTVQAVGGDCNACHHYDTVGSTFSGGKWTGGTWGLLNLGNYSPVSEGWGAHAKHINHIKTRLGITVALNAAGQSFGSGVPGQVCGTCHTNTGTHNMAATGGTDPTGRQINFNDNTFTNGTFSVIYGTTNPQYNGTSGTSSAVTPKTCSNLSCHYFTTPLWSTY